MSDSTSFVGESQASSQSSDSLSVRLRRTAVTKLFSAGKEQVVFPHQCPECGEIEGLSVKPIFIVRRLGLKLARHPLHCRLHDGRTSAERVFDTGLVVLVVLLTIYSCWATSSFKPWTFLGLWCLVILLPCHALLSLVKWVFRTVYGRDCSEDSVRVVSADEFTFTLAFRNPEYLHEFKKLNSLLVIDGQQSAR